MFCGMSKSFNKSSSHFSVLMLNNKVREAFVTSVTCVSPPVRFQIIHVSTVPKSKSPLMAFFRAPETLSRIHFILVAEK